MSKRFFPGTGNPAMCGTCKWYVYEPIVLHDYQCMNKKSEDYPQLTNFTHTCEEWEQKEE